MRGSKYSPVFTTLQSQLPTIVEQLRALKDITLTEEIMELRIERTTSEGPRSFPIFLILSEHGVWRIDGM